MVEPAREMPGRVPTAWAQPTSRASRMVAVRPFFLPLAIRSEKKSRKPVAMRATETKVTLEKAASTVSFTSSTAKRGSVPTMIISTSRRASGGRPWWLPFREKRSEMPRKNSRIISMMSCQ